jgi:ABC-type transporter MlaC component
LKDQGYSINSDFERLSTRVSINHEVKKAKNVNFGYSYSKSNNNGQSEDSGSVLVC